jgi:hypothetical protein
MPVQQMSKAPTSEELLEIRRQLYKGLDAVDQLLVGLQDLLADDGESRLAAADCWHLHSFIGDVRSEASTLAGWADDLDRKLDRHVTEIGILDA